VGVFVSDRLHGPGPHGEAFSARRSFEISGSLPIPNWLWVAWDQLDWMTHLGLEAYRLSSPFLFTLPERVGTGSSSWHIKANVGTSVPQIKAGPRQLLAREEIFNSAEREWRVGLLPLLLWQQILIGRHIPHRTLVSGRSEADYETNTRWVTLT
jgi:hypothetical protein